MEFANRKVMVLGAGISGIAVAKVCKNLGAHVVLSDAKPAEKIKFDLAALKALGVQLILGKPQEERMLESLDVLIVSPGVPIGIDFIKMAKAKGIEVMSEIEVAYRLSKAPLYAVTGTNGKTTTTVLLGELMKTAYPHVAIGGNIGAALSEQAVKTSPSDCVVAEISSYQLEGVQEFRPHIAALLNITPDHLARHGSMEVYCRMKERIFARQTSKDFTVLNYDDALVRSMADRTPGQVFFFSRREKLTKGAFVEGGILTIAWQGEIYKIVSVDSMKIKGAHNVENALAAAAVAFLSGIKPDLMKQVLQAFPGVEHRIEPVGTINGVSYFNDSKATNPESAIKALECFPGRILLIAGGHDKHTDLTEFMQLARQKADALILIGDAAARFREAAEKNGVTKIVDAGYSMEKAVQLACEMAVPPQIVLLSPACASFDMFDGFEERGRSFKEIVKRLGKLE